MALSHHLIILPEGTQSNYILIKVHVILGNAGKYKEKTVLMFQIWLTLLFLCILEYADINIFSFRLFCLSDSLKLVLF